MCWSSLSWWNPWCTGVVAVDVLVAAACVVVDEAWDALAPCDVVDEAECALAAGGTNGSGNCRLLYTKKKTRQVYKNNFCGIKLA